jgi:diaminopimelate epimerase
MDIPFTKAHGTGNDFIILYSEDILSIDVNENLIQKLCNRRTGVGADGLLLLSPNDTLDFKMDYYNNDGSWETMCANGARCAILYMYQRGLIKNKSTFYAGDGPHDAEIINSKHIRLRMKPPQYKTNLITVEGFEGYHVDSGARHFAVPVDDLSKINIYKSGQKIRFSNEFAPKGINVNFFTKIDNNTMCVKTYEKGVEQVMLSCGSGSVAAAYHASQTIGINSPISISTLGGKLKIEFDHNWKNVWLSGIAILSFSSTINSNDY